MQLYVKIGLMVAAPAGRFGQSLGTFSQLKL